ncbi:MAG TPA: SIS domain-containing protein [Atribacteraceae bacterium]|nr:SIS domain-containing protein [Atribacteraceae bacterium]
MSYLREMVEQADVLEALFRTEPQYVYHTDLTRLTRFRRVVFTGMGSSYYAGWYGAMLLNRSGVPALVFESQELERGFLPLLDDDVLLVAVSQSGESRETVGCVRGIQGKNTLGITNRPKSALARACELGFVDIRAGVEKTSATKTYTNTLGALLRLVVDLRIHRSDHFDSGVRDCLAAMRRWLGESVRLQEILQRFFEQTPHLAFMGSGFSLPSARQAALIFGEMTHRLTTALSIGAFFHGLIEQVGQGYGAVFFHASPVIDSPFSEAVEAVLRTGGRVLLVGSRHSLGNYPETKQGLVLSYDLPSEELGPLVEIIPAQCLAYAVGLASGLKPGELLRVSKLP